MDETGEDWEWIIVDDSSEDSTYDVLCDLAEKNPKLGAIRLSRNSGSHLAIRCGLQHAECDCAVVISADLQDPPEIIPRLLGEWYNGAQVVWGERERSTDESLGYKLGAKIYHTMMRELVGIKKLPPKGADVILLDAKVIDSLREFRESNVSLFALIGWLGFRQSTIEYAKQPRMFGRSGWTLTSLTKMAVDSITAFSYKPIRAITYFGIVIAFVGFIYAAWIIFLALIGDPPAGWASLMVVVLVLSGVQMLMLGILGEYLWRALDESRSRPPFVIEASTGFLANLTEPVSRVAGKSRSERRTRSFS
jgi:dolichol-phosphate mannosyltransferase